MSTPGQPDQSTKKLSRSEAKWTPAVMSAGFTIMPNVFFERSQALGLEPLDICIILVISSFWWDAVNKPRPSKKTIADMLGVNPRTIQRRIAALEHAGFIKREQRRTYRAGSKENLYHFEGLIAAATPYALELVRMRAIERAAKAARARRKGPAQLHVVK